MDIRWTTEPVFENEPTYRRLIIIPGCCPPSQETGLISLQCGDDGNPRWVLSGSAQMEVPPFRFLKESPKFCPFCGKKLPTPMWRENPQSPIYTYNGGYYCGTCRERNSNCTCWPPEERWTV
jgi:hypothetical protein